MLQGQTNVPMEFSLTSARVYRDIFNEVEVDVFFAASDGELWRVPAFWADGNVFRVRFAAPKPGRYTYQTVCSNPDDAGLHGQVGELEVVPYDGKNRLYQHGGLRVAETKRTLEHVDGTPFFWLGDTWWMGLCKRLAWPGDFQTLTADRVAKGFTVIQIVTGLYPDMPAFDERGANEAGFPWKKDYERINPAYFDMADLRMDWLVRSGMVPCIVGCWGYFLSWMGVEKMKKHWRNLIARYGAYPVVWCLAGEGIMPYYFSENNEQDSTFQKKGWTELGAYLRQIDPYHRPVTIHPEMLQSARDMVEDPAVLNLDMLQTGHFDRQSVPNTVSQVVEAYSREPLMPVINGEVCYEGIAETCRQEMQRFVFWACVLNGAAGHTYGANGIWQMNTQEEPYGPSPYGISWGNTPWEHAYQLPGSGQLGLAKRLLERYKWWRFEPHSEWVEPHWSQDNYFAPYAAGIPGEVRIVFSPFFQSKLTVKNIERNVSYRAFLFDPINGEEHNLGVVVPNNEDEWGIPTPPPVFQDWLLVLEQCKKA